MLHIFVFRGFSDHSRLWSAALELQGRGEVPSSISRRGEPRVENCFCFMGLTILIDGCVSFLT